MRLLHDFPTLALQPVRPAVGDRVRVTVSAYNTAAPVGAVGRLVRIAIGRDDGHANYTIDREDGAGCGWCRQVEAHEARCNDPLDAARDVPDDPHHSDATHGL